MPWDWVTGHVPAPTLSVRAWPVDNKPKPHGADSDHIESHLIGMTYAWLTKPPSPAVELIFAEHHTYYSPNLCVLGSTRENGSDLCQGGMAGKQLLLGNGPGLAAVIAQAAVNASISHRNQCQQPIVGEWMDSGRPVFDLARIVIAGNLGEPTPVHTPSCERNNPLQGMSFPL